MQFLGYCVSLINTEFPWMHVVKGKPRKPSTQGSVEVSHRAFKDALVKWLDKKQEYNWLLGAYIVQCEVNNCPMRARGNISPQTIYYGRPPVASYSALLGPAYKVAETEFGLRLARRTLMQIKRLNPNRVLSQQMVEHFIKAGDEVWNTCVNEPQQEASEMLDAAFYSLLDDAGLEVPNENAIIPDLEDILEEDLVDMAADVDNEIQKEFDELPDNQFFEVDDLPEYTFVSPAAKVSDLLIPIFMVLLNLYYRK
jgi:hypothetical protein